MIQYNLVFLIFSMILKASRNLVQRVLLNYFTSIILNLTIESRARILTFQHSCKAFH